jgi:hypothetical protein
LASGLNNPNDSVILFAADGTTMIDMFTWTVAPSTGNSYSRCPEGTGAFADRLLTDDARNNCPAAFEE